MSLYDYLKTLVENGGTDLHLKIGRPPLIRKNGDLLPTDDPPIDKQKMDELIMPILSDYQKKKLFEGIALDFSYVVEGLARFRGNICYQLGNLGAVFRVNPLKIKTIDELKLPDVLKDLVFHKQGIILVTGPTGSGKSTTLASLIDHLNRNAHKHIITIEDPIEYVHTDNKCTITYREIGTDTPSFNDALKMALRQDPDVILVGEMRDVETIQTAVTAAETGHLVFSTLHTNYAKQTISRICDAFPPEQQHYIRVRIAMSLVAAISQRLIIKKGESEKVVAMEIMINTPTIKKLIAEGKLDQIDKAIAESSQLYKMQTMNQHLLELVQNGFITKEDALENSSNPNDLRVMLQTRIAVSKEMPSSRPSWMKDM